MHRLRALVRSAAAAALLLAGFPASGLQPVPVAAQTCANAIVCENQQPGTPISQWDLTGIDQTSPNNPLGFTDNISYTPGATVTFKITTPASAYTIDIYRMGYYAGNGARQITSITPSATLPQTQPPCQTDATTGLIDCGNWAPSATWTIPSTAVSGVYFAKLTRTDGTTGASHIPFVVRDDTSHSDIVFQTSDTAWQAYNDFGGNSLYTGSPAGRAYKVSYNRPFHTNVSKPESWLFSDEEPAIRYLEANGFNVSYISGVDTDRYGATLLTNHKIFVSVGHDEYWSAGQRTNVESARDHGVNLAFLSGNEIFWKTRWENSIDGTSTAYRTLVSYKETQGGSDPMEPAVGTATWRDPRFGLDARKPENALSGNLFMVNGTDYRDLVVPANYGTLRFWRGTTVAQNAASGNPTTITAGCDCVLGYEWDAEYDNGFRPAGLVEMSSSTYNVNTLLQDFGVTYAPGTATHHLTLYRAASGALVFGTGTVNWAAALDNIHSGPASTPDASIRQAMINLFADMGVQPGSLQSGLSAASASSDKTAPTSTITSLTAGAHIAGGTDVVVKGTASDTGGGQVAGVEISVDGGTTWHPASGTTSWTYTWRVGAAPGPVTISTRAVDDSGNLETPGAGVTATIDPAACPCTIFHASEAPAPQTNVDAQSVEVGVRFRADQNGYINGVRFFKQAANTGTHVGTLWTNAGQRLAQATFANETATGWQYAAFVAPVAVTAGTTYIASYHAPNGGYSATSLAFATAGEDNAPLHALKDGLDGPNGVYQYSSSTPAIPTWSTFNSTNYWVDVNFSLTDTVPPTVISNASTSSSSATPLDGTFSATFSKDVNQSTLSLNVADPTGAIVAGQITYNKNTFTETFTPAGPLALGTTYTATIAGVADTSGNVMTAPYTWTQTTPTCPCSLWTDQTVPAEASHADSQAVEVGMHFRSHIDGYIKGVRFYQGPANTGPFVGNLWSGTGTLLASVNITPAASPGWVTANFGTPIEVQPETDYVISYHTNSGGYALNSGYFGTVDTDVGPLIAPALVKASSGSTSMTNGVYVYGASAFPINPTGSNYWVDVVFSPTNGGGGVQILSQQVTKIDQTTAALAWTTDKLSDSLVVYGTTSSYGSATPLNTKQVTAHSATLTGLTPNTLYHYQLKSRDSAGNQATSGDLTLTTAPVPDTTPPVISSIATSGENSSTKQLITWTTNEVADSEINYGTTSSYGTTVTQDASAPVLSHKVELTNLQPSTTYHFQVGSQDPSKNLATSSDMAFTTGDVQISGVNAQVPGDVTGDTAATISWTSDAPANTVLDYGLTAAYGTEVSVPDPVTSHSVKLTGLTPGTTYHYQVHSTANGHTATSSDMTFATTRHQPPVLSAIAAAVVDYNTETVTWTTDEASTSEVDFSTDTSYSKSVKDATMVTGHSVTLTGLTPGTTYHFIVKSTDTYTNTATSADQTFTSKAQTPPQITAGSVQAKPTSTTAVITWSTTVASDSQVNYGLTATYGSSSALNSTAVLNHSVTLTGLQPSTTYHYQVLSRDPTTNLLATSGDYTVVTAAPPDVAPVISAIEASVTTTTATITWSTDKAADSQVDYGTTATYGTTTPLNQSLVTSHSVTLTSLQPNTVYHFRVKSADTAKTLTTSPDQTFTTLPPPRSLALNGTTAYAEAPSASEVNVLGDWTVETWFKDTSPYGYEHLPTAILVKGDVVTDKEIPFAIGIAFNQLFVTEKSNNVFSYMYYDLAANHVTPNAWHHLAISVKGSTRQATLYLDGVQVLQGTLSSVTTVGNSKPVDIGRNGAATGYGNFQGLLDDVRIWNTVRTPAQISASYHAEFTSAQSGLVANWKFDEGTGTTAADTAGGSPQNATLNGGATWSTDVHS